MPIRAIAVAFYTIANKEVTRFLRIWVQTILPPAISMTLYFIIFGGLIGPRIGPMNGFNYIDYILPGIIMMSVINSAYANVVSSFFGAKFQSHIEEMLVAPIPNIIILLGFVTGGVVRSFIVAIVVTIIGLLFTNLRLHSPLTVMLVILLTAIIFSLGGMINGIFAKKFDDVTIVPTFVLTPLIYLGGVFYSINLLPVFWQQVSRLNPVLYMVDAFRYGMLGKSDVNISTAFIILGLFSIIAFMVAWYLLNKGTGIKT